MKNFFRTRLLLLRSVASGLDLLRHPDHLDRVFTLADSMGEAHPELMRAMVETLRRDPMAERALREQPRVGKVDLDALSRLPEGSLGREFAAHMRRYGLDPQAIPTKEASNELEYLQAHLYETHDIWHTVTGFGADIAGEVGLQAFYAAQMPSRLGWLLTSGGLLHAALFDFADREPRMRAILRGWLLGKRAKPLFGIAWREYWSTPIDEIRRMLRIDLDAVEAALPPVDRALAA